jgi:hypothetical protein
MVRRFSQQGQNLRQSTFSYPPQVHELSRDGGKGKKFAKRGARSLILVSAAYTPVPVDLYSTLLILLSSHPPRQPVDFLRPSVPHPRNQCGSHLPGAPGT